MTKGGVGALVFRRGAHHASLTSSSFSQFGMDGGNNFRLDIIDMATVNKLDQARERGRRAKQQHDANGLPSRFSL